VISFPEGDGRQTLTDDLPVSHGGGTPSILKHSTGRDLSACGSSLELQRLHGASQQWFLFVLASASRGGCHQRTADKPPKFLR
jgi:hypothetical protein